MGTIRDSLSLAHFQLAKRATIRYVGDAATAGSVRENDGSKIGHERKERSERLGGERERERERVGKNTQEVRRKKYVYTKR
jgi:hypothetical protein